MKPIEIYNDKFLNAISWFMRVGGISLFPFIIMREYKKGTPGGQRTVNHETIHFWQTLELGIIPFYLLYILFWLKNLLVYRDLDKAYHEIPFEREAYGNQENLDYIKERKAYAWLWYV